MLFTSLSPNLQNDDLVRAITLVFQPWRWLTGTAATNLEDTVKKYLPASHAIAVNTGRTALYAILTALGIGPGDEVAVQAYTCVAVPAPVLWRGATPLYIDCDEERLGMSVNDLRKKITPRTKALIIQHTFGTPAKLDELITVAREHNLIIIEDCAHALGANFQNRHVGTFGDVSFFSFGRDKIISSVFGGMITTNNAALAIILRTIVDAQPLPTRLWVMRQLLHPIITSIAKATYSFFGIGKAIMAIARVTGIISLAVQVREYDGGKPNFLNQRMPNALAILAQSQLRKIEEFAKHRRAIAHKYRAQLDAKIKTLPEYPDSLNAYLRFPIFVDNPQKLIAFARTRGIELGNWYQSPVAPPKVMLNKIRYTTCPTAERLSALSCNLPTGISIKSIDAQYIIDTVNEYVHGR